MPGCTSPDSCALIQVGAVAAGLLWAMWLHGKTWFEILPKTIPYVYAGGRRVPAAIITRLGWAAAIGASVILLGMVAWTGAQS